MIDEAVFIEKAFRNHFDKSDRLVIYGLGKNTKVIVENCKDYNIVGLMDGTRTGEKEWGLPILDIDEVNTLAVKKIIIIATAANVPIIYKRIEKECSTYDIDVYDINGLKLEPRCSEYKLNNFYDTCTSDRLKALIDVCDVISFDIFDTLLVRDVLLPTDIFVIVEKKNSHFIENGKEFKNIRVNCERKLYETTNPNIYEIYDLIQEKLGLDKNVMEQLLVQEIDEEKNSLVPRKEMLDILKYAVENGKIVICTSDMYLPSDVLGEILNKAGYNGIDKIFVSCEYRKTKSNGLFEIIKNEYCGKKILHIGDNYDADIIGAQRSGIDETFQVPSIFRMITDGVSEQMLCYDKSLADRRELGKLFSKLYNNPFLFASTRGKCKIEDNYNLGYMFIEPLLAAFINWLEENRKNNNTEVLLLGARDGLIIKKMYDLRSKHGIKTPQYEYVYASRYACTLAGLKTKEDVEYAFNMAFDGSPEEMLIKRFNLSASQVQPKVDNETSEEYLGKHIDTILRQSEDYANVYRKYLDKMGIKGKKVGFFDFVSSGTCQLWLENIADADWNGYYFIRNLDKYKEHLTIDSYFKPRYVYEKQSKLFKNYIFMENIMTSYEPTLWGFSENNTPIFDDEKRTMEQISRLKDVHHGIIDAYEERLKRGEEEISQDLVDDILDMLNGEYSVMCANFFDANYLEDEFCNRTFDLKKMVNL